jgi:hypothetical protein
MANKWELTVNITDRQFVTSRYDSSTFTLDKLFQGDVLPLRVRLVAVNQAGGLTDPFDLVTAGSVEVAIVTPDRASPVKLATTGAVAIAADGSDYYADCTLALNTTEINGLLTGTATSASTTIEVEYINGSNSLTPVQQSVTLQAHGIDAAASSPSPSSSYYTTTQTDANFLASAGGTMAGDLTLSNASKLFVKRLDDTAITGAGNYTLDPGAGTFIKLGTVSGAAVVVGISGGTDGRVVLVYVSDGGGAITVAHDSSTETTAANRIYTTTGADVAVTARGTAMLIYDAAASRWVVINISP